MAWLKRPGAPPTGISFRTPSLRNVELSAPYLHDGSAHTLAAAIFAHDSAIEAVSQDDAWALEAFLNSLTDPGFIADKRLALPTRLCGKGANAGSPPRAKTLADPKTLRVSGSLQLREGLAQGY